MLQHPGMFETIHDRLARLPRSGELRWIGLRTRRHGAVLSVDSAIAVAGHGLQGDHRAERHGGKRQITLLQWEHLAVIASLSGNQQLTPALLRRNLLVAGINLLALRGRQFRIGEVVLEGTGPCDPCSRMESALGPGGLNAMRGHGGLTAMVVRGGALQVGAAVMALSGAQDADPELDE
jgi:MOSC domain-containing protein YiiM